MAGALEGVHGHIVPWLHRCSCGSPFNDELMMSSALLQGSRDTLAPSRPLEEPRPLPARHGFVELALFRREEMQVVLDHIRAEGLACQRTALQLTYGLAQRARHL